MKIDIYNQNFELTEPFKEYLLEKMQSLEKYQADIITFQVGLSRNKHHKKGEVYTVDAKVTMPNKKVIFVKYKDQDPRAAVDQIQEKLARQLVKIKTKKISKLRKTSKYFKSLKFWRKKQE